MAQNSSAESPPYGPKSMTGFARADGCDGSMRWFWEVRSVNGRGLDIRVRLPQGFESLEPGAREAVGRQISRGNVTLTLTLQHEAAAPVLRINTHALSAIAKAIEEVRAVTGAGPPNVDGLLALRGVMEIIEELPDAEAKSARDAALLATLEEALSGLDAARHAEGRRLTAVIRGQLNEISRLIDAVAASPARTADAVRARLEETVRRLIEASPALDPQRLHQEAVLLAVRSDVEEELQRLKAHIASGLDLLNQHSPVGRKLDFLTQELNREANTLTSKAIDIACTQAGLGMKTLIDQMREQVQNIE